MKRALRREESYADDIEYPSFCTKCGHKVLVAINVYNSKNHFCSVCRSDTSTGEYLKDKENYSKTRKLKETPDFNKKRLCERYKIYLCGAIIFVISITCIFTFGTYKLKAKNVIEELKSKYPSQKNETWYHILSVLETEVPNVKSIILLHGKREKRTVDCLTRYLLYTFSKNDKIKIEDVSYKKDAMEFQEYGEVLEYYHPIIKEHGVFVANLDEVPAKIARIFHTLCDETSSDIKPSLFIFALQYHNRTERMKPMQRATTILQNSWKDLAVNEIHPLLSRVVKNVVDIQHEEKINCGPKS